MQQVWARLEVPYGAWPWPLFMFDGTNDDVPRRLYSAHPCCLDEYVCEPLRARFSLETWLNPHADVGYALKLLMAEVRRRFSLTNMHMERRIREARRSAPISHGRPRAETLAFTALLAQLFQRHLALGFTNPFVDDRASMIAQSLPVKTLCHTYTTSPVKFRSDRLDVAWVMRAFHEWRRVVGSSDTRPSPEKLRELWSQWNALPHAEQALHMESMASSSGDTADAAQPQQQDTVSTRPKFYAGDEIWPVSPEVLIDYNGGRKSGFAGHAAEKRWESRARMVSQGGNLVPPDIRIPRRLACHEAHPGLCATVDRDIYAEAIVFGKNLDRWVRQRMPSLYTRATSHVNRISFQLVMMAQCHNVRSCIVCHHRPCHIVSHAVMPRLLHLVSCQMV